MKRAGRKNAPRGFEAAAAVGLAGLTCLVALSLTGTMPDVRAGGRDISGLKLGANNVVGKAFQVDNLTIFPIYAKEQPDIGEFMTLDAALKAGVAEVREMGGEERTPQQRPRTSRRRSNAEHNELVLAQVQAENSDVAQIQGGAARVNTLVIQNNGGKTILVLAGTVVVGGKQDRQVGQDFVIPPKKTVPVDAFCVEHGRWSASREGKATGGKFGSVNMLANQKVRGAGQYKEDQSEVWKEVSRVNQDNKTKASTDTLVATLSDGTIARKRRDLASKLEGYLSDVPSQSDMVGLAYAIDGEVRGARWFINRHIYTKFQETLINTMTTEAITAQSAAKAAGRKLDTSKVKAGKVKKFVEKLQKAGVSKQKKTRAGNENRYRESDDGYNSECLIEKDGQPMPVTSDFLMK